MADEVIKTGTDELVETFDGGEVIFNLGSDDGLTFKDGLLIAAGVTVLGKGLYDLGKLAWKGISKVKEWRKSKKAEKKNSKKQETEEIEDADYVEYEPDEDSEEDVNGEE